MFVVAHNGSRVFGGGEIGTAKLLAALQARGHRVLYLCRDEVIAERVGELGIPTGVHRIRGTAMIADSARFAARLRALHPDVLLLTTFKKVFLAGLGARMARVPLVVQRIVLSTDVPRGPLYRLACRRFLDAIVCNAELSRRRFLDADPKLSRPVLLTLHDGVSAPVRSAAPGTLRRALGIPDGAMVIGSVGRLASQKRFDRLVRALPRLPGVHLVIAGEGPQRAMLEALAEETGAAARVHLLGFRRDVGDVLDALDLYVVSSDLEGMANAMLEAMAAGLPVVSTDVSGAREALACEAGGAPGVVVDRDDDALLAAIGALLGDRARLAAMGERARGVAETAFGWDRFVDDWERLLLTSRRGASA
jgi:glycosyltransferase involved in cell wall biosynthesis